VLFNHGEEDFIVEVGDRICQLLVIPVLMLDVEDT
jgi:dUTPase